MILYYLSLTMALPKEITHGFWPKGSGFEDLSFRAGRVPAKLEKRKKGI